MNKPQSFSDLIDGWAQGLALWWVQSLAPILTVIVSGMDAYVDSRARAIVEQVLSEYDGSWDEDRFPHDH